jgi:hypothetical protein
MIAVALVIAFGAIRLPHSAVTGRLVNGITVVMLLAWAGKAGVMLAHRIHDEHGGYVGAGRSAGYRWPLEVSESLGRMGVAPGTRVGFVGYSTRFYWARLAGVRIVSELRDPKQVQRFWLRDQASRERILNAFRRAGATVVVTEAVPPDSSVWTSLGSGFEARWLRSGDGHVRDLLREAPAEEVTEVR